ncbi:unnamed protein product [Ascophyllum nodosum]
MLRKAVLAGAGALGVSSAVAAYIYRPRPWADPPEDPLCERAEQDDDFLMKTSRVITFVTGTAAFSLLVHVLNKFEIKDDEHYRVFVEAVRNRPSGVPLLTVANHCSPLDDPGVFVGMLPPSVTATPELMRWTLCAKEICFRGEALQAFFGAAKAMPICRGSGIDQRLLLNFYRRLLAGGWCHVFPEGHCEQGGSLGGRTPGPSRDELGRLKWGVGKMIAHAPVRPLVIPVFHTGMANVMPLNPLTRKILHTLPRHGNTVTARAGPAISFEDLIEEHERRHGPLRKMVAAVGEESGRGREAEAGRVKTTAGAQTALSGDVEGDVVWRSTPEERQLYSKIARRVEDALLKLEAEARQDLGDDYPGWPSESVEMLRLARQGGRGAT